MARDDAKTLALLLESGQLLSSKLELAELLTTVLGLAARVVEAESASLLLLDERTQELYFDVALGLGEEASRMRLKMGQGIAGCVAQARQGEIIGEAQKDPRWSDAMDKRTGFTTRSILAAPMLIKGRLIGVIEAINKKDGAFDEDDLRTLEAFGSQASVAIENARLFSSLSEERYKLKTVFAQMSEGALLIDAGGRVLLANEAAERYLAAQAEPVRSVFDALKDRRVTPPLQEIFSGASSSVDFEVARESPQKLILAGQATRVDLGGGRSASQKSAGAPGWLCVFRDVTEERAKELLKRTFLSLISHKLKTPLASIIGYSDMLLYDPEFKQEMPRKAVKAVSEQGRKLSALVDKLLKYVTLEDAGSQPELKECSLDELVGLALTSLRDYLAAQKAEIVYERSGLSVMADAPQIVDVVKNLVENAVKFDSAAEKKVSVTARAHGRRIEVAVADRGPGIPPEHQEKVFSRFHQIEDSFTGQVDGWGLGLPFVKKVVERHGGAVFLNSKLGAGTTVTFSLARGSAA